MNDRTYVLASIAKAVGWFSRRSRSRRAAVFREYLKPCAEDKILDLGSCDGSYLAAIVPFRDNVYIADISEEALERGRRRYGVKTVLLPEDGALPFPDGYFDIVHCNSVIARLRGFG